MQDWRSIIGLEAVRPRPLRSYRRRCPGPRSPARALAFLYGRSSTVMCCKSLDWDPLACCGDDDDRLADLCGIKSQRRPNHLTSNGLARCASAPIAPSSALNSLLLYRLSRCRRLGNFRRAFSSGARGAARPDHAAGTDHAGSLGRFPGQKRAVVIRRGLTRGRLPGAGLLPLHQARCRRSRQCSGLAERE